jgi:hypothetical protein
MNPHDPNNLSNAWKRAQIFIKRLLNDDIPVFVAVSNKAKEMYNGQLRTNVDAAPAISEGPDYPVIVVGNVDSSGTPQEDSQQGPHVQLWAPGTRLPAQDKDLDLPKIVNGTSASVALMAGMLATYLAYDTVPFDTTPDKLAAAAKHCLIDHTHWQRQPNIKVLWNEVDEAHNPKKASSDPLIYPAASIEPAPAPTSQTAGPPPATAPYAEGVCAINVTQMEVAVNPNGEYKLEVTMTDNNKAQIGYTEATQANATHPLYFQSKLEEVLVCVPESRNDYITFALGAQQWPSNGKFALGAVPSCTENK